jgi:hypothetical protein
MARSVVEKLYTEFKDIADYLDDNKQPSLSSDVDKHFKKVLLLSAASYFEHEIQSLIEEFIKWHSNDDVRIVFFLKKKAISGQYHTYFSWGEKNKPNKPGKNANSFFTLFGQEFKNRISNEVKENKDLDDSIKAFLWIGHIRNILVHSNFAAYNLDNNTVEEIYSKYNQACTFLGYLEGKLFDAFYKEENESEQE